METAKSRHLANYKTNIKHWALQELKYDWEAELSGTGSRSRVEFWVFRVFLFYILNNDMGTEALRLCP